MITSAGLCSSFKLELLEAVHNFLSDAFYMALYTNAANLNVDDIKAYVTDGEVSGPGYTAGGQLLRNVQVLGPSARTAFVTWDDPIWLNATLTARGALLYNQSKQQRAVAVINFLEDQSSNTGEFRVKLPSPGVTTALIRLA
jgi:hypothetical protein